MFKNIGIYIKEKSGEGIDAHGLDILIDNLKKYTPKVFIEDTSKYKNDSLVTLKHSEFVSKVDLIIVFGGDGTLLRSARKYLEHNIPILGINMGTVGFLTDVKTEDFESIIKDVVDGNCKIEERNLVSASFNNTSAYGLNEIVIHSGAYTQLMRYRLSVNNKVVYEQRSDGLIIATPTGSTAYALSSGGPIMHPSTNAICLVSISPHTMSHRPFILHGESEVIISLLDCDERATISFDAQSSVSASEGVSLRVKRHDNFVHLIHPKGYDYFEIIRSKLHWGQKV